MGWDMPSYMAYRHRAGKGELMLAKLGRLVADALLPPLCLSCGGLVGDPGTLCPACWSQIAFLAPPFCAACGHPFEFDPGDGGHCGACLQERPRYRRARAVFRYDDATRGLILRFKHSDRIEGVPAFARWMARAGADLLADADLLVPVPLHRWRLLARRYNQAALLAVALGRLTGRRAAPDLLVRRRRTKPQGLLGREAREANVKGAIAVREAKRGLIAGRTVLLVDDVMTTGATAGECARALLQAGAAHVDLLTLGRVVMPA
jgi:ComF family protein